MSAQPIIAQVGESGMAGGKRPIMLEFEHVGYLPVSGQRLPVEPRGYSHLMAAHLLQVHGVLRGC